MTIQWITAIGIVDDWSQIFLQKELVFAVIEQVISPLVLFVQLFLTKILLLKNFLVLRKSCFYTDSYFC